MAPPSRAEMMNWAGFLKEWQAAAEEQGFEVEVLLEKAGYPVFACSKGSPDLPTIYLSSGVHGDEPSGPQALLGLLKDGYFDERFHWLICPVLNPTGLVANTRENAEGVDLNRDYHHCEAEEVCAHISWLKKQEVPSLFLSLHEDWESTGFYYYEINTGSVGPSHEEVLAAAAPYFPPEPEEEIDDHPVTKPGFYYYEINTGSDGPSHEEVLAAAAPFFPPEPEEEIDDHPVTKPGWIFHPDHPDIPEGWPEAIYLSRMGCPLSLTFETPSSMELEKRMACHQAVVRCALDRL